MLDLQSTDYKSKDELREIAPSIFSTKPSPEVSSKYSHIPTDKLIDDMDLLGWKVIDAKEVQARQKTTRGFQKHLVVFRNPDIVINQILIIQLVPNIEKLDRLKTLNKIWI